MIKQKDGFTLVDILMVITIMLILSAIAMPRITSYNTVKLFGVANKLAMDIRYTQQLAISKQKRYGLSFNPNNESYFVYEEATSVKARDPFTRGDLIVNCQTNTYYKGIDLVSTNFGDTLIFNQEGKPYNSAGNGLVSDGQITLQSPGESITIFITQNTGRISIQ